jgi:ribosomal-protein-alanine N-acetyltransferase
VRVLLRPPVESDRVEFIRSMAASEKLHEPWISEIATDDYFDRELTRVAHERYDANLVCLAEGGAIVGVFNISEIVRGAFQSAFLSYAAVSGYEGQGLMSEGLQLLLDRAFMSLELHRLEANIQPGNAPSIALVRRAGFVREGTSRRYLKLGGAWRDHEHWVILAEDWAAQSRSLTTS